MSPCDRLVSSQASIRCLRLVFQGGTWSTTALEQLTQRDVFRTRTRQQNIKTWLVLNRCLWTQRRGARQVRLPWCPPTCSVVMASRCALTDWWFAWEQQSHTCSFPASAIQFQSQTNVKKHTRLCVRFGVWGRPDVSRFIQHKLNALVELRRTVWCKLDMNLKT